MSELLWVPSPEDRLLVDLFAEKYVEKEKSGGSGRRGDVGPNRLTQAKMGKYAELAWCEITGGEPDFELWAAGADATRPDITGEPDTPLRSGWDGTRLHVKTCNMSNAFKDYDSWTAARWDQIVRAPAENDIILLSYTAPDGDTILLGWVYATDVAQHWEQCKIASMSHKRAIYFLRINKLIHDPTDTPRK